MQIIIKPTTRNGEPVQLWGATRHTLEDIKAMGTPLASEPMSRLRAIWYGAGLVFGSTLVAVAVFGVAG